MSCCRSVLITIFIFTSLNFLPACTPASEGGEAGPVQEAGQSSFQLVSSPVTSGFLDSNPLVTVKTTLINDFLPLVPTKTHYGTCQSTSVAVNEPYAWRCQVNNKFFDPCLTAADGKTIVCGADPFSWAGFKVTPIHPLPTAKLVPDKSRPHLPWLLELADGVTCRLTKKTIYIKGQRVNYLCSDHSKILGEPKPGEVWRAERVVLEQAQEGWKVKESKWIDVFAVWQTVNPDNLIKEIGLAPHQVQMRVKGLADNLQGRVVPASPPNPDTLPSLNGAPAHLRFSFDDEVLAPWVNPSFERQLLIYPVESYRQMFEAVGISEIDQRIKALQHLLAERPETPDLPLPILPPPGEATHDLAVQVKYLDFAHGSGIRFITRYSQAAHPFSNEELFYTFQGLTADGHYYITLFYPVSTPLLPDHGDVLTPEEVEKVMVDYPAYQQQIETKLNALEPDEFTPDLSTLDKMIVSLHIEEARTEK